MRVEKEASGRRPAQVEAPRAPRIARQVAVEPGIPSRLAPAHVRQRVRKPALALRATVSSIAFLILLSSALAQEAPKPGREHDSLKRFVGTWEAETESGKGTMTYRMDLGGLWLTGDFEGEFGGLKFHGKSLDSYDPATRKYRGVWVDSFTTAPRIMEGSLDNDGHVLTMTGEGPGPDGQPTRFKSITESKDADSLSFALFMLDKQGKEQQMVKIMYKRKK